MNNGTLNNGTLNNGTLNNGTLNNGTLNNGTLNNGTLNNSTLNNGILNNVTLKKVGVLIINHKIHSPCLIVNHKLHSPCLCFIVQLKVQDQYDYRGYKHHVNQLYTIIPTCTMLHYRLVVRSVTPVEGVL